MNEGTVALIVTIIGATIAATWKVSGILTKIYVSMERTNNTVEDHDEIINSHKIQIVELKDQTTDLKHRVTKLEGK